VSYVSVKISPGKMNIMLPPDRAPESGLIEALWIFSEDDKDR
jgi:hypothetical protein